MATVEHTQCPIPQKAQKPTPCRQCGSSTFRRTHRRHLWDRLFSLTGFYPVRCAQCHARYYRFRPQFPLDE